ncbi:hypothetical protein RDV78_03235 [Bacillota bacterium LX-D]|nr:hypothetical protein [Bacillota bacterium LX-D]
MFDEGFLQTELKWVKYKMQILDMIEGKLQEIKALAEQVASNELVREEIENIQARVNKLISEIKMLEQCNTFTNIN